MRGNAARGIVPALVVLALVSVVAIAATGSTTTGTGDARPPAATLLDTILSLGMVAVLAGGVMLIYGLTQRKAIAREIATKKYRRTTFVAYAVFMTLLTLGYYWRLRNWRSPAPPEDEVGEQAFPNAPPPQAPGGGAADSAYEPRFAWIPVAVVLTLAVAGVAAYLVAERRRRGPARADETLAEQLALALDDTLDDLRAESDPRRAVIAAYARLERVLAAHGIARRPAETPEEYFARILGDLEIDPRAVRRLTDLFSRAKFSQHEVDAGMKEEAIQALEHVRDELREARSDAEERLDAELASSGVPS